MYGLETVGFKWIAAALLPDIDAARLKRESVVIVETTTDHRQLALGDGELGADDLDVGLILHIGRL